MSNEEHDCFICGRFGQPALEIASSPIGGAFSAYACGECRSHRAAPAMQAAWRLVEYGIRPGETFDRERFDRNWVSDLHHDGEVFERGPITVYDDGRYVDIYEWIGSQSQIKHLAYWEERWASPGSGS